MEFLVFVIFAFLPFLIVLNVLCKIKNAVVIVAQELNDIKWSVTGKK